MVLVMVKSWCPPWFWASGPSPSAAGRLAAGAVLRTRPVRRGFGCSRLLTADAGVYAPRARRAGPDPGPPEGRWALSRPFLLTGRRRTGIRAGLLRWRRKQERPGPG